jgi:hypothetical protein
MNLLCGAQARISTARGLKLRVGAPLNDAVAVVLLIGIGLSAWVELLFPAWILALSIDILTAGRKVSPGTTGTAPRS